MVLIPYITCVMRNSLEQARGVVITLDVFWIIHIFLQFSFAFLKDSKPQTEFK